MHIALRAKTVIAAACLAGTVCGHAAVPATGPYIGIGLGTSAFDDDGMINDYNQEVGSNLLSLKETATGYKIYGGYKFNAVAAVEAAFTDYGEFSVKEHLFGTSSSINPTSLSLSANLGYDFAQGQFRPFILLGVSQLYNINLNAFSDEDNTLGLHMGFGFQYDPIALHGVGIRVAYEGDAFGVSTGISGATYVRESYSQSAGMLYVGVHYRF